MCPAPKTKPKNLKGLLQWCAGMGAYGGAGGQMLQCCVGVVDVVGVGVKCCCEFFENGNKNNPKYSGFEKTRPSFSEIRKLEVGIWKLDLANFVHWLLDVTRGASVREHGNGKLLADSLYPSHKRVFTY
jgi:hypothetical protein